MNGQVGRKGDQLLRRLRVLREEAWARLESDLDQDLLDGMTATIGLADATTRAEDVLAGRVRGRTVVDVRR